MAVSIGAIYGDIASDRSRRIAVTAGSSLADVIAGIETVLTTAPGGWSIHDASAGTNAKCYKSLQKDGSSYTYMVLDWNTTISTGIAGLCIRLYEDWNATTHAGTNKAENSKDRSNSTLAEYLQGQKLPYGETDPWQLDVHVLPGGAAFYASREVAQVSGDAAFLGSPTYGGVTVVGEMLRENPNTLPPGVPAAIWFNGGRVVAQGITWSYFDMSLCRSFDGRASNYSGSLMPGFLASNPSLPSSVAYTLPTIRRTAGWGGRSAISSLIPMFGVTLETVIDNYAELGQIRGVLVAIPAATHDSVWEVATDSDYLIAIGGTNRKFRCYGASGGPLRCLLPL